MQVCVTAQLYSWVSIHLRLDAQQVSVDAHSLMCDRPLVYMGIHACCLDSHATMR